uniref:transposase n=1 Tax=Nonomuraea antri TaxID=2730852 RepID=UPI001C2B9ADC
GSPCVARQYSGTLGKVANCQVGISVHAVTDVASCPLEWGLFVPPSWDGPSVEADLRAQTAARRVRCSIPDEERHRSKATMAVEMLDTLAGQGLRPPLLVADAGYGGSSPFRGALDERGIGYVVQVG